MQVKNLTLKLIRKLKHNNDVTSFIFQRPNNLQYKAGQYIVMYLDVNDDPEGPSRPFTLASSPTEDILMITTHIRDTPFKRRLDSLDIGIEVNARGPLGRFILQEDADHMVMIAGGIGITPFRSMIRYATDKMLNNKITLLYSNNDSRFPHKDEFDAMISMNKNLKVVYTVTGIDLEWKGRVGRINEAMIREYCDLDSLFYICGPPGMVDGISKMLKDIGAKKILTEGFIGY